MRNGNYIKKPSGNSPKTVLILPMRNGNQDPFVGILQKSFIVLILPMRNGNTYI